MDLYGDWGKLKLLEVDDVSSAYVTWMNDYDVVKYTESRFTLHSFNSICNYVKNCNEKGDCFLFGIFDKENTHIGNIKLDNIHAYYRKADIGIIIGEKKYWGKGIATQAIMLLSEYAFAQLNLNKVYAGIYEHNVASQKAFLKAGFTEMYRERDSVWYEGKYQDCLHFEKYAEKSDNT